jgi:RNA polymerase sigma-70 factor (ECF subfamily)
MHGRSDEDLAGLAQGGDRDALSALFQRYETRLYNYARRMTRNDADAEDLVQDAFLRVHSGLRRYDARRPFRPWMYRIMTNLCRDHHRRRLSRGAVSLDAPERGGQAGTSLGERLRSAEAGPDQRAAGREEVARLEAALDGLPHKLRSVFLLARYEGLSYEEIAASLRVPLGTVKSRMNRAASALTAALREPV